MKPRMLIGIVVIGLIIAAVFMMRPKGESQPNADLLTLQDDSTSTSEIQEESESEVQSQAKQYDLLEEQSKLTFYAEKIVPGLNHTGTVGLKSGTLSFDGRSSTSGKFVIDMTSITESKNNEMWLKHAQSADFFDVENYPEAVFEIVSVEFNAVDEYVVNGNLTIKGQTHDQAFRAYTSVQGDTLRVKADFNIDRTRWGINFGSGSIFKDLGDKTIKDEITFTLDLVFAAR